MLYRGSPGKRGESGRKQRQEALGLIRGGTPEPSFESSSSETGDGGDDGEAKLERLRGGSCSDSSDDVSRDDEPGLNDHDTGESSVALPPAIGHAPEDIDALLERQSSGTRTASVSPLRRAVVAAHRAGQKHDQATGSDALARRDELEARVEALRRTLDSSAPVVPARPTAQANQGDAADAVISGAEASATGGNAGGDKGPAVGGAVALDDMRAVRGAVVDEFPAEVDAVALGDVTVDLLPAEVETANDDGFKGHRRAHHSPLPPAIQVDIELPSPRQAIASHQVEPDQMSEFVALGDRQHAAFLSSLRASTSGGGLGGSEDDDDETETATSATSYTTRSTTRSGGGGGGDGGSGIPQSHVPSIIGDDAGQEMVDDETESRPSSPASNDAGGSGVELLPASGSESGDDDDMLAASVSSSSSSETSRLSDTTADSSHLGLGGAATGSPTPPPPPPPTRPGGLTPTLPKRPTYAPRPGAPVQVTAAAAADSESGATRPASAQPGVTADAAVELPTTPPRPSIPVYSRVWAAVRKVTPEPDQADTAQGTTPPGSPDQGTRRPPPSPRAGVSDAQVEDALRRQREREDQWRADDRAEMRERRGQGDMKQEGVSRSQAEPAGARSPPSAAFDQREEIEAQIKRLRRLRAANHKLSQARTAEINRVRSESDLPLRPDRATPVRLIAPTRYVVEGMR